MNQLTHNIDSQGTETWFNAKGQLHKINGPALIYPSGDEVWFKNGKLHRIESAAVIYPDGYESYYINGKPYE